MGQLAKLHAVANRAELAIANQLGDQPTTRSAAVGNRRAGLYPAPHGLGGSRLARVYRI